MGAHERVAQRLPVDSPRHVVDERERQRPVDHGIDRPAVAWVDGELTEMNGQTDRGEELADPARLVESRFENQLSERAHGHHLAMEIVGYGLRGAP